MRPTAPFRSFLLVAAGLLGGCDMLGIDSAEKIAAAREADGKAIGGACRHAGRAIEDCYAIYRKADRAAVFAGWRDMNDYMRENKIEPVVPQLAAQARRRSRPALRPRRQPPPKRISAGPASRGARRCGTTPSAPTSNSPTRTRWPPWLFRRSVVRLSCCPPCRSRSTATASAPCWR